jgi:hypothetical protein
MHRPRVACGALLAGATALALSACGSSSNTTTSSSGAANQPRAAPTSAAANSGSSFCTQVAAMVAQLGHLTTGIYSTSPGATPDVAAFKQLFAVVDSAVDALDSSAPSEIASAFHTLRAAYDPANAQVQSATTFAQVSAALSGLSVPSISSADKSITTYMTSSCGIGATPTP